MIIAIESEIRLPSSLFKSLYAFLFSLKFLLFNFLLMFNKSIIDQLKPMMKTIIIKKTRSVSFICVDFKICHSVNYLLLRKDK